MPPMTRTLPSPRSVAVCRTRGSSEHPGGLEGACGWVPQLGAARPPVTRTRPSSRSVAACQARSQPASRSPRTFGWPDSTEFGLVARLGVSDEEDAAVIQQGLGVQVFEVPSSGLSGRRPPWPGPRAPRQSDLLDLATAPGDEHLPIGQQGGRVIPASQAHRPGGFEYRRCLGRGAPLRRAGAGHHSRPR